MQTYEAEMGRSSGISNWTLTAIPLAGQCATALRFDINSQIVDGDAADQAEANTRRAEANTRQAEANTRLAEATGRRAEANGRLAEANARRAEANTQRIEG
ncbi:MAG: hypothetical protein WKG07_03950 [Hymenobacter sp.]